ncbi:MAG TPA: hypothetical protein VG736_08300 [Vicinamibacterales bacterium]|nr:hypothetical protein [Vicinamibacterales bacterium]
MRIATLSALAALLAAPMAVIVAQSGGNADHQAMLAALHITSPLRPGPAGRLNPDGSAPPNFANYDESKATARSRVPPLLVMSDGRRITTPAMWEQRRKELFEIFDREIYGRVPAAAKTIEVTWEITSTTQDASGTIPTITRALVGHVDPTYYPAITVDIMASVTTPANAAGKVPVIIQWGGGGPGGRGRAGAPGAAAPPRAPAAWQQDALSRGWGYGSLSATSIQPDAGGDNLTKGIIGLINKGERRKPEDWGALRAWAWGASRLMDYFETDALVDARQIALEGHSRYGKATIVTMVYEPRILNGFVSSSGEGGAKLWRHLVGQSVESLANAGEYYWMAGNFIRYGGPLTVDDLPIDQHQLIALVAPRPIFISGGEYVEGNGVPGTNSRYSLENWQDTPGTFMATAGASPVWKLLGKKPLSNTALGLSFDEVPDPIAVKAKMPPPLTPLIDGDIAFRQHDQGHTDVPNWPTFLEFCGRYFKAPGVKR